MRGGRRRRTPRIPCRGRRRPSARPRSASFCGVVTPAVTPARSIARRRQRTHSRRAATVAGPRGGHMQTPPPQPPPCDGARRLPAAATVSPKANAHARRRTYAREGVRGTFLLIVATHLGAWPRSLRAGRSAGGKLRSCPNDDLTSRPGAHMSGESDTCRSLLSSSCGHIECRPQIRPTFGRCFAFAPLCAASGVHPSRFKATN